jgi:crotonobetainyl-CoA:carnitine CoA-transferase CaiB-like acyl-CoA transferase
LQWPDRWRRREWAIWVHWPINGYMHGDESSAYLMLNRNKRSIVLDLKNEAARTVFLDLVRQADILVQNFRPRVAKKLGIDYETLAAVRPELVYVSISGYGDEGPMVDRPGQDLLVQSFSGLTFNGGTADGLPHPSPVYMVDTCASHHAPEAALAGSVERSASEGVAAGGSARDPNPGAVGVHDERARRDPL